MGLRKIYTYDRFDELLSSGKVDAKYLATPKRRHAEFVFHLSDMMQARSGQCQLPVPATADLPQVSKVGLREIVSFGKAPPVETNE